MNRYLLLLLMAILLTCDVNNAKDAQGSCILESVQYDDFNRLRYMTLSGGVIYQMRQEFEFEGEVRVLETFDFRHFRDSSTVNDISQTNRKFPYLTAWYKNDKPVRILRYFGGSDVQLYHDFDYSTEGLIKIDLSRIASTGDYLYFGYAVYYQDENGNIYRNEQFAADPQDSSVVVKVEDRFYSYDTSVNPQQYDLLPYFASVGFPDVRFFSQNNIISFVENNQIFSYSYDYGFGDYILTQYLPNGNRVNYSYVNCGN